MSIYSSSKVLPYVYQCIHKTTGKIYIGSRANKNQKLPSHLDLQKYRTSSKIVKPIFDEFDWFIIAEFFNPKDAYDFEQQLIHEQWQISKEMSLNRFHHYGKKSWNTIDHNHSKETKNKMSEIKKGIPKTEDHIMNMSKSLTGRNLTEDHKRNMRGKRKPRLESSNRNMSKIIDVLTPDGFVIENTTLKELCSQFNLSYMALYRNFRNNKPYKGFTLILVH